MRLSFQLLWLVVIAALVGSGWWWVAEREDAVAWEKVKPWRTKATLVLGGAFARRRVNSEEEMDAVVQRVVKRALVAACR